jgi:hypothetical protein
MKRSHRVAMTAAATAGLTLALLTGVPAASADSGACARMGSNVTILGISTPSCVDLYTSGSSSVVLPANTPRIIYGVINMTSPGVAPSTFTDQTGRTFAVNPVEGQRWLTAGPSVAARTIVKGEIVNNRIGRTFPYLFITDDAITDRFAGKSFIGRTKNSAGSKKELSLWTRIDWAEGLSADGGLKGAIANYKRNIVETGQCKPSLVSQQQVKVKERFGSKGRVKLDWKPGVYQGQDSFLLLKTQTGAVFTHPAPTALKLARKVWRPSSLGFSLSGSKAGLSRLSVNDIRRAGTVKSCSLP